MKYTEPKIFLIGQTAVHDEGLEAFLTEVGAPDWETDATSGGEVIAEVAGRGCYRSFAPGLNKNVTKVREGNKPYLGNIANSKHGSVFAQADATLAFVDVSRVFTHEMVRHSAGTVFSQESLRYVRLDALKMYYPRAFGYDFLLQAFDAIDWEGMKDQTVYDREVWATNTAAMLERIFRETAEYLENVQVRLSELLRLDDFKENKFHVKKALTSSFRRLAPEGLATMIIVKGNHRAWRYIIESRTATGAEEEIRDVFWKTAIMMRDNFPNFYQDMIVGERVDGIPVVTFANSKI